MARPLAPFRRLLRLRERVEQGEKMALRQVEVALRTEEEAFASFASISPGKKQTAASWQMWQQARDSSWQRARLLEQDIEILMERWQLAKREHRQAELLLERREQERTQEEDANEVKEQEDWVRARDARSKEEN